MGEGNRKNLERLLRCAWEKQHFLSKRSVGEMTRDTHRVDWNKVWPLFGLAVTAIFLLIHDQWSVASASILLFGSCSWLFGHIIKVKTGSKALVALVCILSLMISAVVGYEDWPQLPYCYAVFYSTPLPNGWVGGPVDLGLVEEIKGLPATNVQVTAWDITSLRQPVDSKTVRGDFQPIVYPYFTGLYSACRINPTRLAYTSLGKKYQITISVGNGETTEETVTFTDKGQCITLRRLKDAKIYIKM